MKRKKRKQHMQPGYNQTHTLENRSTISSHVNQTGKVAIQHSVVQTVTYCCHGIVRELHRNCMILQTSSESNPSDRDIVLLRIKINSKRAPDIAATPGSNLRKRFANKSAAKQHRYHAK